MVICYLESFFSKSLGVSSFLAVFSDLTMKVNFPVNVNCSANQCTGFYMITAPVMKGLSNSTANQKDKFLNEIFVSFEKRLNLNSRLVRFG